MMTNYAGVFLRFNEFNCFRKIEVEWVSITQVTVLLLQEWVEEEQEIIQLICIQDQGNLNSNRKYWSLK